MLPQTTCRLLGCHVHDERIESWPILHRKQTGHRFRIHRIGPQPIDRLGREGDQSASLNDMRCLLNGRIVGRSNGRNG